MRTDARFKLPEVGEVGPIPIDLIRPFKGQPRSYFDERELRELADSIAQEGQRTPAWVMPLSGNNGHRFELIAGERRFRACRMAGIPTLMCEVRQPESDEQQYLDSVMENFGRKECTILESARAVSEVFRIKSGGKQTHGAGVAEGVARVFARSGGWVYQMLSISRLHPKVIKLLEPPQKITTQAAISLASLHLDIQVQLAEEIAARKLNSRASLMLIKNHVISKPEDMGNKRARPYEDFKVLSRFLEQLGNGTQLILEISPERRERMFKDRPAKDLEVVLKLVNQRVRQLQKLESDLRGIGR